MDDIQRREILNLIRARFARLYGDQVAVDCLERLRLLLGNYAHLDTGHVDGPRWSQADCVLITYGDMVHREGEKPLATLSRFLTERLSDAVNTVHILPFYPWSSDDGFSVIDYRAVKLELGAWSDVEAIGHDFTLMFDLVLNHCSKHSEWFADYMAGVAPQRDYFIEVAPGTDLSAVTRPRQSPLLTPVNTRSGEKWVWTTFSDDQVDLNFANPDVLLEFLDILLGYVSRGARIIRLDAIAYLWKQVGTTCIHLPETHEVVKLMRNLLELVAPRTLLLTETNVPHTENVSYFGHGDEADMVYNFTLPPLLLHALLTGSAKHLTRWADGLGAAPDGCTYFNFTASHDGVGVRPLEGVIESDEITRLTDHVKAMGGHVSEKANPDGTTSPYEMNITYFDALGRPDDPDGDVKISRFLCSQAVALALRGVPAVYFHSLVAASNDHEGVEQQGYLRAINRHKWHEAQLLAQLGDPSSQHARVFDRYQRLLRVRRGQSAFHPDGAQRVLELSDSVFAIERTAPDGGQRILAVHNVTDRKVVVNLPDAPRRCRDLLRNGTRSTDKSKIELSPYQCAWLSTVDNGSPA